MPIIEKSTYEPPAIFRNSHLNTVHASLFRRQEAIPYERERITTSDGDFIDIDAAANGHQKAVILLHGLEGNSTRNYMIGMARQFYKNGYDAVSMNFRGCSGEPNVLPRSYHVGDTEDLNTVIQHLFKTRSYDQLLLVGFSMGGNVILKYIGEESDKIDPRIKSAAAISVPCDIPSANVEMEKWYNWHYLKYLVSSLKGKYKEKIKTFPDQFSIPDTNWDNTFRSFDEHYTAPVHGFNSAMEYWIKNSSIHFLKDIKIPTLLINAEDDTFLSPECFPTEIAKNHPYFYLETPKYGGHVGFCREDADGSYWSERRVFEFVSLFK